jgi:tetratricopeptide (TPR) repeat protein
LAVNYARTGRQEEAITHLRSLSLEDGDEWISKIAVQELARELARLGREAEAVEALAVAVERWPDEPGMKILMAWTLERQGDRIVAGEWISGIADGSDVTGGSARFRYHRWYLEGLADTRRALVERSRQRAREAVEALAGGSTTNGES